MMRKLILLLFLPFILACQHTNSVGYKYSETETNQFLNEITQHAKVIITDITEIEKQPTNEFLIYTRYPLSASQIDEYNETISLTNKDDDISDFASYTFKGYELINENSEKLHFIDDGRAIYLQEFGLWKYDDVLCQNLGINVKLNKKYEKLSGYITMEFEMPGKIKKEVTMPVNISIYDILTE